LIGDSVKKVQTGTREAVESRKAMEGILSAVCKVTLTMTDMQTAQEDQRRGVLQVSRAVEQMNQGTQQTAAMVEEVAATAESLSAQARELIQAVAAFKLADLDRRVTDPHVHQHSVTNDTSVAVSQAASGAALPLSNDEVVETITRAWHDEKPPMLGKTA